MHQSAARRTARSIATGGWPFAVGRSFEAKDFRIPSIFSGAGSFTEIINVIIIIIDEESDDDIAAKTSNTK